MASSRPLLEHRHSITDKGDIGKTKGIFMQIEVTQDFLDHRAEKASLYNRRGRNENKFLMDLDAELLEWYMINIGEWEDEPDNWMVDAIVPDPDGYKRIDVKFVSKWYNISDTKMHNILQQRKVLDGYIFCEWVSRPDRPFEAGDKVEIHSLGYIPYEDLVDLIKVSRGKWGGFYADVRKALVVHDVDIEMYDL